jgi:glucose-6-phosphate isomerase
MQETAGDDPGRCFAVEAAPGEVVVVPPGWAHATISADPQQPLAFGAWCVRDYGFDYRAVRAHGGLAWFPRLDGERLAWEKNPRYSVASPLVTKRPARHASLGLRSDVPIWTQYLEQPETIMWVPQPDRADAVWTGFTP